MAEKKKPTYCDEHGHTYEATTSPGWFRCLRPVKYSKRGVVTEVCGSLALCPGCLGYRPVGCVAMFCVLHYQTCHMDDFPLAAVADAPSLEPIEADQLMLW